MSDHQATTSSLIHAARRLGRPSLIDRIDPRVRVVAVVAFSVFVALANRFPVLLAATAASIAAATAARVRPGEAGKRLAGVNGFVLAMILLLPLTTEGQPLLQIGRFIWTREGLLLAGAIALKANAIVLALTALLGSLDISTLGHALSHLRVPEMLIHLLLFTVRYVDVIHREGQRLRAAMKVRGFRPGMSWHTYRAFGYLVGMLLVRSHDRSERIRDAMKCRGFRGRFYLLDHFRFSPLDFWFSLAASIGLVLLGLAEWAWRIP
jgi:cobalt/nickel transport system permease protein